MSGLFSFLFFCAENCGLNNATGLARWPSAGTPNRSRNGELQKTGGLPSFFPNLHAGASVMHILENRLPLPQLFGLRPSGSSSSGYETCVLVIGGYICNNR